jgi:ElaB/YqjD/DUF883 family membrane-anchored ribosome-binding protein
MNHTPESSNDPETIRSEIDQTRERMDQTIDALAERVKGRHLLDELLGFFRSSNGVDRARQLKDNVAHSTESALHSVAESIKANPAPVLLIGAGITWVIYESVKGSSSNGMFNGRRTHGIAGDGFSAPDYPDWPGAARSEGDPAALAGEYWGANAPAMAEEDYSETEESAGAYSAHVPAEGVKAKVGQAVSRVREKTGHLRERSREWREHARERSHELYDQGRQHVAQTVHTHPLSVGLGCLATGIVAGLLIPSPRRASEALRPQAQRFRKRAVDAGRDLAERGRHVADAAVEAMTEEARHQGLTPEALKEKAATGGSSR